MDFTAAKDYLEKRLNMPTDMTSRVISDEIPAQVRAHCFFSARVAESNVLERLRGISDSYGKGEIDLATARMKFKKWYDQKKPGERFADGEGITNIASTMRLDLVMRQNAAMAAGVGRYQVSRDPAIEERWPCWRYITGPNARDAHAALDGKVFLKSDPIWNRIYPPWEFNCNCDVEDAELPEKGADKIAAEAVPESDSGFKFDPAEAFNRLDPALITDDELRKLAISELEKKYGMKYNADGILSSSKTTTVIDKGTEEYAKKFATNVDFKGIPKEQVQAITEELDSMFDKYQPAKMLRLGQYIDSKDGVGAQANQFMMEFNIDHKDGGIKGLSKWVPYSESDKEVLRKKITGIQHIIDRDGYSPYEKDLITRKRDLRHVRHNVGATENGIDIRDLTCHEFGHVIMFQRDGTYHPISKEAERLRRKYIRAADMKIDLEDKISRGYEPNKKEQSLLSGWDITSLSKYSEFNRNEFFAEAFCARERGETLPDDVIEMLDSIKKGTMP